MAELVGGKGVPGELVEAAKVEEGVFYNLHLVKLVEVGASCIERFACFECLFNVRPNFGEGVAIGKVFGALAEVVKVFTVSAARRLLEAPAWLDGVAGDVDENVLSDQA